MRRLGAEQCRRVGMVTPDHVTIEDGHDLCEWYHGMRRVIARTEESALLGTMVHEEQ